MSMDNLKIAIEESVKEAFGDNAKYILRNWEFRQEFDFIIWAEENPSYTKYPISYDQRIEQALEKARWVHEHILTPATVQVGRRRDDLLLERPERRNGHQEDALLPDGTSGQGYPGPEFQAGVDSGWILCYLHQPGRSVLHLRAGPGRAGNDLPLVQ